MSIPEKWKAYGFGLHFGVEGPEVGVSPLTGNKPKGARTVQSGTLDQQSVSTLENIFVFRK